ncbi:hypothetical protein ACFVT8_08860 [Lysinibacillus sp. NPDC058147]|uniref:hypothetical protein n=1 Tax=unclassified Lysinibacillus TaxID=2636778 RepID=UPI0036DD170E
MGIIFQALRNNCKELSRVVLSGKYKWNGNLDAFNDILFGGFGEIEVEEEYTIIWRNSDKSKNDLGYEETIIKLNENLERCHPSNKKYVLQEIKDAKMNKSPTIFDSIKEIILDNKNVTLILE